MRFDAPWGRSKAANSYKVGSMCALARRDFLMAATSTLATSAFAAPTRPRTVLLAHGLLGFSKIGPVPYFNGVQQYFDSDCTFLTPGVAPAGAIRDRAAQLVHAIPPALQRAGAAIHIVAHSMGGLDARVLISDHADWFASLTTISTPNLGSQLADLVTGERKLQLGDLAGLAEIPADILASILKALQKPGSFDLSLLAPKAIFEALKDTRSYVANILGTPPEAFNELTTSFLRDFNRKHTSLNGVPLLCYAGNSNPGLTMCRDLYVPWAYLKSVSGDSDGIVPVSSSSSGTFVRTVPADHLEAIGLAGFFDSFVPTIAHYDIGNLYRAINAWQKTLDPA